MRIRLPRYTCGWQADFIHTLSAKETKETDLLVWSKTICSTQWRVILPNCQSPGSPKSFNYERGIISTFFYHWDKGQDHGISLMTLGMELWQDQAMDTKTGIKSILILYLFYSTHNWGRYGPGIYCPKRGQIEHCSGECGIGDTFNRQQAHLRALGFCCFQKYTSDEVPLLIKILQWHPKTAFKVLIMQLYLLTAPINSSSSSSNQLLGISWIHYYVSNSMFFNMLECQPINQHPQTNPPSVMV